MEFAIFVVVTIVISCFVIWREEAALEAETMRVMRFLERQRRNERNRFTAHLREMRLKRHATPETPER